MTFGKCTKCPELEEEMGELRRTIETHETKITETESQLSKAEAKCEEGIILAQDFLKRLDIGEQWEAQMARLREWAGGPDEPE